MSVTAKGPPYISESHLEREYYSALSALEPTVYTPPTDEDFARHDEALADLLEHEAPWENSHQVGGTHYSEMKVQPWDAMRAWMTPTEYAAYHIGTVIGYLSRHRKKGGLTDIKKAHHHLSELIRYFENEEEYE